MDLKQLRSDIRHYIGPDDNGGAFITKKTLATWAYALTQSFADRAEPNTSGSGEWTGQESVRPDCVTYRPGESELRLDPKHLFSTKPPAPPTIEERLATVEAKLRELQASDELLARMRRV